MTTEIDWSKAPEGATHVGTSVNDNPYWYKLGSGDWYLRSLDGGWVGIYELPTELTLRPAGPLTFGELSRVELHELKGG